MEGIDLQLKSPEALLTRISELMIENMLLKKKLATSDSTRRRVRHRLAQLETEHAQCDLGFAVWKAYDNDIKEAARVVINAGDDPSYLDPAVHELEAVIKSRYPKWDPHGAISK